MKHPTLFPKNSLFPTTCLVPKQNPPETNALQTFLLLAATFLAGMTLFTASPAHAQQDTQIAVNVDPRVVQTGGRLTYTIDVVTQNNLQINLGREPDFGDLQVVGRMTAPQFTLRNGQATRQLTVTYTLAAPREPGTHRIEPPIIEVGQSRYTPVSLDVKVVERADLPAPEPRTEQDFYIDVTITPDRAPYVGEQILISYDLFVDTRKIQVRPRPPSEPALDAFWIEDLSEHTSGRRRAVSVGSRLLEQTPLRTFIAFPLKPGPATIDTMKLPLVRGSFFGPTTELHLDSDERIIEVQPLPPGAPPGFHAGNVGQWRFTAELNTANARVGDSVLLTLTAQGRGRASQLRFQDLPAIDGLRVVHDTSDATRLIQGTTLHGTRTQTITLMPLTEGEITIPALSFSYFDPDTETYQTLHTQPLTLNVLPGGQLPAEPPAEEAVATRTTHNPGDITAQLLADLHPPVADYQVSTAAPKNAFPWIAATPPVLGILLLLFGGPLLRRRSSAAPRASRKQQKALWTTVNTQIAQAESQIDDPKTAYATLTAALHTYVSQSLNVPSGALTEKDLRPHFAAYNVPAELQSELFSIANTCNNARFAPPGTNAQTDLLATAERLRTALKQLEKHLARHKPSTTVHTVALIFSTALLLLTPSANATESPDWKALADAHPADATLQLNAGTTLALAGDFPRARLYLERASLLDPGHPAIKQNLDLVRQLVVHNATSKRHPRFTESLSGWQTAAAIPQSTLHLVLLLTLWLTFFALLARRLAARVSAMHAPKIQTAATLLLWMSIAVFALTSAVAITRTVLLNNATPAILVADAPALREGPSPFAALLRTTHHAAPGMMVNILETRRDGWLKIEIADNTHGWMQSSEIAPIHSHKN